MTPEPAPTPHDTYAALRSPNYRVFAAGFMVSSAGLQMLGTAILWEIYDRTGDALHLGYIGLARALPVVLFALPAGHIIDRFDRKRVLVLTQVAMGLLAGVLALVSASQAVPIFAMYGVLALMGCARAFNGPSRSTLLPLIVEPDRFHNAVTWNSSVFHFSAIVGPIVAGVMLGRWHAAWPVYAATAAGCMLFAGGAMFLRPREAPRETGPVSFKSITAGAGHIYREKTVLSALTLDLFAVLLGGATALLPIYAKDILNVSPEGLGMLRAAPFVGAFVMAIALAHRPPFKRAGPALLWSVAAFGLCMIVFGLSTSFILSLVVLFVSGAVDSISVVVRHVLVQMRTPNHLRGRVSAVNSVFIESSNELGGFESGLVASIWNPVISVVSGGIGTVLVVMGVALKWPQIRKLGELREQPEMVTEKEADERTAG